MNTSSKVEKLPILENLYPTQKCSIEIWKAIPEYNGHYLASSLGNIKSIDRKISCHKKYFRQSKGTTLKPSKKKNGYLGVTLFKNGKRKYISVHRVIAITFLPNPNKHKQVNHINGIKNDNRASNLEWVTISENIKHSFKYLNRPTPIGMKGKRGKLCPTSKRINQLDLTGNLVKTWDSMQDASRAGFQLGNIYSCCKGNRKTHKGYKWQYA